MIFVFLACELVVIGKRFPRNRVIAILYTSKNFIFIFDFLIFLECV